MTQMFFEENRPGPGMHALVIGVGGYAHLPGGAGRAIADPLRYGNLGQLTSPPRSALEFATWLRESDPSRWTAPLASIDLRISPAPTDPDLGGSGSAYRDATIDSITEAYDVWKDRCASDENNVAVFYFCGHGLQSDEQLLLASDFGRYEGNHFRGAFSFESTRTGFLQRPPRTQCFFIDACREVAPGVTMPLGGANADPLDRPDARRRRHCDHDLTLQSSTPFAAALGRPRNVSYFTAALINAMQGGAAVTDEFAEWVVRTDRIAMVIDSLVEAEAGRPMPTAKGPAFLPAVLYRLDGPPDVELTLACVPEPALCRATLFYEPHPSGRTERKPPMPEKWNVTLKAGYYRIGAEFEDHTYAPVSRTELINPPTTAQTLRAVSR
ncbi:caspase family protein [Streptomyces sp. NPDC001652]|uniref:caspase family protein n=1 Tax=Streptomyces sp. NPDC001652 TaxID=3154393 RepID=UPI003332E3CA